jgi:hypothetical protein
MIFILAIVFLWLCTPANGADRCRDYVPDVRRAHVRYLGLSYPWWYGVGQLKQESGCRASVTAFDQGQGIAQFMPKTSAEIQQAMNEKLNPYNPEHATRMQAFYMRQLHRQNPDGRLCWNYQAYNGGWTNLKREATRAGIWDWTAMKAQCRRKIIPLGNGLGLDLCAVNYDYPIRVYRYGDAYRLGVDQWRFW